MVQSTDKLAVQHKPGEVLTENPHSNGTEKATIKKSDIDGDLNNKEAPIVRMVPPTDASLADKIQHAKIDLSEKLNPAETALYIVEGVKEFILFTLSNFSCLTGKAKSKKTFFVILLLAAAIRKELYDKLKCGLPEGKRLVIFFDTEQSRHKVQQVGLRICHTAEVVNPDNLQIYSLRAYAPNERMQIIEEVLYQNRDRLGLAVIDGIRDIIFDINNPEQAVTATSKLLRWTEEFNIHIVTVLHQNKGDNNARGHLGTEIINKAETVLSISKSTDNPDISIVEPEYCREIEFTRFAFTVGEMGLPCIADIPESKDAKKTLTPFTMDRDAHMVLLNGVFSESRQMLYKELVAGVKLALQGLHGSCGDNKSKDFIAYYKKQGWLRIEGTAGTRGANYVFTGLR